MIGLMRGLVAKAYESEKGVARRALCGKSFFLYGFVIDRRAIRVDREWPVSCRFYRMLDELTAAGVRMTP